MSLSVKLDAAAIQRELNQAGQESWKGMSLSAGGSVNVPQLVAGATAVKGGATGMMAALAAIAQQVAVAPTNTAQVATAQTRSAPKAGM